MTRHARLALPFLFLWGVLAGCSSGPRLKSPDLTLVAERPSQQRPSVTSLALNEDGSRLAVGDYVGRVALLDVAEFRRGKWAEPVPQRCSSAVLALGAKGSELVAVPRRGGGIGWQPEAQAVHGEPQFAPLSGALVTPSLQVVCWSVPARTLSLTAPGGATTTLRDVKVAAADAAGDRVVLARDRAPENATLELRSLPKFDVIWALKLDHPATGVALDPAAGLVAVSSGSAVELRALADGALLQSVPAPDAIPVAFRDGARFLLVREEALSVLHLGAAPAGAGASGGAEPPHVVTGFLAHRGGVGAVAFSADARWLATGGARGDLLLFSVSPPVP